MLTAARTTAAAALTALAVAAVPATPALAWGKKEQGFLAGVVTAVIIDELIEGNRARRVAPAPAPVYPAPVYSDPAPATYSSVHATPAARAFNSYSREERKAIQRGLRHAGYYSGGIDGVFGPGTYNAVTAYARASGAGGNLRTTGGAFAVYDGILF